MVQVATKVKEFNVGTLKFLLDNGAFDDSLDRKVAMEVLDGGIGSIFGVRKAFFEKRIVPEVEKIQGIKCPNGHELDPEKLDDFIDHGCPKCGI